MSRYWRKMSAGVSRQVGCRHVARRMMRWWCEGLVEGGGSAALGKY